MGDTKISSRNIKMKSTGKADYVVKESGCGPFQILLVLVVNVLPKIGTIYGMLFMTFGNYNPGWRCMDNYTTNAYGTPINSSTNINTPNITREKEVPYVSLSNFSTKTNRTSNVYSRGSCEDFQACHSVKFDPETSTMVTEWGLLCDKRWVPSLTISVQMSGVLVGSLVAGQLGDAFGRRLLLYIPMAIAGVLCLLTVYSTYFEVFIVLRFFIGLMIACIYNFYNVYPAEFLTSKWRTRVAAIPSSHAGGVLFGISAMIFKDWKILHMIVGVYFLSSSISFLWVPESIRWLEVKNKPNGFENVIKKINRMNKLPISIESRDQDMMVSGEQQPENESKSTVCNVFDLFRKGYRVNSCIIGLLWYIFELIFYTISYSVKAMYGNFYLNLIMLFVADIPFAIFPMIIPDLLGRKRGILLFMSFAALSLITATILGIWATDDVRTIGLLILVMSAKMNIGAAISCCLLLTTEMYPTVVRGNAMGYGNLMSRLGGITTPLLIPNDTSDLSLCFGLLGALCLFCCLAVLKLPETKGMKIKEVFDED